MRIRNILLSFLLLAALSLTIIICNYGGVHNNTPHFLFDPKDITDSISYTEAKALVNAKHDSLLQWLNATSENAKQHVIDSAAQQFVSIVNNYLFPFWYGTDWDFNGTTEIPGKGSIACGYFVTTVLRDAGYPISRVKLAQCASEQMIDALTDEKIKFSNVSFSDFLSAMNKQDNGLYIIGLDNHTGFLLKENEKVWFIHSSFVYPGYVNKEEVKDCSIIENSAYKVVGSISGNREFILTWLKNP